MAFAPRRRFALRRDLLVSAGEGQRDVDAHLEARIREVFPSFRSASHLGFAALLLHELLLFERQPVFRSELHLLVVCRASRSL